jgi:putative flavoprotein involved in K+ transport
MRLYGRLRDMTTGGVLSFADDLAKNLDAADAVSESIKDSIDGHIAASGTDAPEEARYTPVWEPGDGTAGARADHTRLDLAAAGVTAVVWATGFGADYRWIEVPVFDGRGYPTHRRGVTSCPGLYFLGLPWQHSRGSALLGFVHEDAAYLADRITSRAPARQPSARPVR